jgi:hypothetical protein
LAALVEAVLADLAAEAPAAEVQAVVGKNRNLIMEKIEDLKNKEIDYEFLRQEIADLILEEIKKKEDGQRYDQHLLKIDAKRLASRDLKIFEKFKTKELTKEEFLKYQKDIEEMMSLKEREADSSATLMGWIGGKVTSAEWVKLWDPETYKRLFPEDKEK